MHSDDHKTSLYRTVDVGTNLTRFVVQKTVSTLASLFFTLEPLMIGSKLILSVASSNRRRLIHYQSRDTAQYGVDTSGLIMVARLLDRKLSRRRRRWPDV